MGFSWVAEHEGMRFPMRGVMTGPAEVTVMVDDDHVCPRCERGECRRCVDVTCTCCGAGRI